MRRAVTLILLLAGCFSLAIPVSARKTQSPRAWVYAGAAATPVLAKPGDTNPKAKRDELERGSLSELLQERRSKGELWWKVRTVDLATLAPVEGWAEASQLTQIPSNRYPADSDLLTKMGQPFLDDFVASHTVLARYLVRQGNQNPLLVCYAGSRVLPEARLQIFRESGGVWSAGPHLGLPFAEMNTPITKIEIRDLLGNRHECLISTETAQPATGAALTRMVIRSVAGDSFQTLWEAPLKLSVLDSYPAKIDMLSPPAKNIGRAGTVTTGTVTFQARGAVREPVWQGKVDFFVIGREKPVQTVSIHKVCAWTGSRFEPLR
jgi:hypothetical protein